MSTNYPNAPQQPAAKPSPQGIYRGQGAMGEVLKRMQQDGRKVITEEATRLLRNRQMYLGNHYLQPSGQSLRAMAPTQKLKSGRRRDTINRLRQFVDGRVALLTREVPPYEVQPRTLDLDDQSGARLAERLVRYQWTNRTGWNIDRFRRELVLVGEQDGIGFGCVTYDQAREPLTQEPIPVWQNPETGKREPVTDRELLEALKAQDPRGESLWSEEKVPLGDVRFRVVRVGRMSIDPMVTSDWSRCRYVVESDIWSIEHAERVAGKKLKDLVTESGRVVGVSQHTSSAPALSVNEGAGNRTVPPDRAVTVHEAYVLAQGPGSDWPKGAHVVWIDSAPNAPILVEPWERGLPYWPYTPKPDALEILRSRGTVDELSPIQVAFNRTLSAIGEWLDLLARPVLLLDGGALKSNKPIFNEERMVELTPGATPPGFMRVPPEPVAVLSRHLDFYLSQMAEIAVQHDVTRGTPPGQGVDAGVALDVLGRNNEIQMTGTEAELRSVLEWALSEALSLVADNYQAPRLVNVPGVDDADAFEAFVGSAIRGCTHFKITGSIMPRSRDQMIQALLGMVKVGGRVDPSRHIIEIMRGDVEAIEEREQGQRRRQASENRTIAALGRHPLRDTIWQAFVAEREKYFEAFREAGPGGQQLLAQAGIEQPSVSRLLRSVKRDHSPDEAETMRVPGMPAADGENWPEIPSVEPFDEDPTHVDEIRVFCTGDGFRRFHPLVQQVLREHLDEHESRMRARAQAAQAQIAPPAPPTERAAA